ncbi:hypothetical protein BDN71DRAFT_1508963 [Pleurotus eryngii]|uniref:Secreted protein n=1 Tax=Pleurotus eryngii TaxID=5323 RepID=A0A9P6DDK6_PLEER|nr:hypothetical protein BDN71DRAFT_1508963 [Pleurotus eryngii]
MRTTKLPLYLLLQALLRPLSLALAHSHTHSPHNRPWMSYKMPLKLTSIPPTSHSRIPLKTSLYTQQKPLPGLRLSGAGARITAEPSQALNKEPGLSSIVPPPILTPSKPARHVTRSHARVLGL